MSEYNQQTGRMSKSSNLPARVKIDRPAIPDNQADLRAAYLAELANMKAKTLAKILTLQAKYKDRGLVF